MEQVYILLSQIILKACYIYTWIILAYCAASMAVGFGIIDIRNNRFLMTVFSVLARLVEPVLNPIRSILPNTGVIDLSPLVLLLGIQYLIPFILKEIFRLLISLQSF